MRTLLRHFFRDESGNIAIMSAGVLLLIVGCAALGVDVGTIFADRRKVQSAADLAAIVAASDLTRASAAATAVAPMAEPTSTATHKDAYRNLGVFIYISRLGSKINLPKA